MSKTNELKSCISFLKHYRDEMTKTGRYDYRYFTKGILYCEFTDVIMVLESITEELEDLYE